MRGLKLYVVACLVTTGMQVAFAAEEEKKDFSPAEQMLFMSDNLSTLPRPGVLKYAYRKSGSLEEGFVDTLQLEVTKPATGACCTVQGDFAAPAHRLKMPEITEASANPVTMYFLERDVREMHRLTKGQENYYRKRIRLAVWNKANVADVTVVYKGKPTPAKQIEISPYDDDPVRARFEKFARKSYVFTVADSVPGGIYAIRSVMRSDAADAAPLVVEELTIEGAEPAGSKPVK